MSNNQTKNNDNFFLEETIRATTDIFENGFPQIKERLQKFVNAFDEAFHHNNKDARNTAQTLMWILFPSTIFLYATNLNGAAITEIHSVLELFTIAVATRQIASDERYKNIHNRIERYTLPDAVKVLVDLDLLTKDDLKFAKKLNNLRNGLAHKNAKKVSNAILSGRELNALDITSTMATIDCIPLILNAIKYLLKLLEIGKTTEKP